MKLPRRKFLRLAAGAAALAPASRMARAQAYPSRPVHVIVGQAAGSSSDITARLIGQWVSRAASASSSSSRCGPAPPAISRPRRSCARAPDGYTLLLVNAQNTINAALYEKLNFDFLRDIAPVAGIDRVPLVMEVNPSFPAKTVPEFIAYAKANPGKINMASAGIGGPQHVAGELFKFMAGVDMVHVPYRGSTPALTDLLGGQVQVMFDVTPTRRCRRSRPASCGALAVTDGRRGSTCCPTCRRWPIPAGLRGRSPGSASARPRARPPQIIETLNKQFNAAIADATIRKRLADLGAIAMPPKPPAEFARYVADDADKWAKVIKAAGIKAE